MNNIDLLEKYLKDNGALRPIIDDKVKNIVGILNSKLTHSMKIQLVSHFFCVWASQFRIPIRLEGQDIPINSIAFLFSYSGSGKDTTITAIKNIFKKSFERIKDTLNMINMEQAEIKAANVKNGKLDNFLTPIPPLEIGISTPEGLMKSLDNLNQFNFGSLNINTNEFMNELTSSSANVLNLMSNIAEMYDIGYKNSKQLKNKDNEVSTIEGIFLSALFTSSFNILQDNYTRNKLINEFKSRFARRSSITFNNIVEETSEIKDLNKWLEETLVSNKEKENFIQTYSEYFYQLTNNYLLSGIAEIQMNNEAERLFYVYRQYCNEIGKTHNNIDNVFVDINYTNRFFQALKLSGAITLVNNKYTIDKETLAKAINIIEIINEDIKLFENELNKDSYEIIIDYCHSVKEDSVEVPIHTLKRANLITSTQVKNQLDTLVTLANSKDEEGIYELNHDYTMLKFKVVRKTSEYGISYLPLPSNNKEVNKTKCDSGYKYSKVEFTRLANMLKGNFAYSAFEFLKGKRSKENCIPICNMIIFDIDNSEVTIHEAHSMLEDMKHIVCTTSDKDNIYKFRIILPFDAEIEISNLIWNKLVGQVAKDFLLGMQPDILPQAQIFFAYKDSIVLMNEMGDTIHIKDYVSNIKAGKLLTDLTPKEKHTKLENAYATFNYAYHLNQGSRNKALVRTINDAFDLNASFEQCFDLVKEINSTFNPPLEDKDFKNVLSHLYKKYGKDFKNV